MEWVNYVSYFFGAAFLSNAIPHYVSGVMGRPFQSPFAKPPGQGFSSSLVNVLWGSLNLLFSYLLLVRVGEFDLHNWDYIASAALGFILMGLGSALGFGRFNGGNAP